ncbi:MAG: GNAT family N-acetyltransferase, partial [Mesorhizobium sp.]
MHTVMPECDARPNASGALLTGRNVDAVTKGEALGRIGNLEVRLARNEAEIAAAQEVRYRVFYDELGARKNLFQVQDRRDADHFDPLCDHLLVFDTSLSGPEHRRIVGTYRLLRQEIAAAAGGFYSEGEFELTNLI